MSEPAMALATGRRYRARIATSEGTMVVALDADAAPRAVNSFVSLARRGFYDRTRFHRLLSGFAISGGCPRGDGTGDAGFAFEAEAPARAAYPKGTLALATQDGDRPLSGSQFFLTLGDLPADVPARYPVLGAVVEGHEVLDRLNRYPTRDNDVPAPALHLRSVEIVEDAG